MLDTGEDSLVPMRRMGTHPLKTVF